MLGTWCLTRRGRKASWLLWGLRHSRHWRWLDYTVDVEGLGVAVHIRWISWLISSVLAWVGRRSVSALELRLLRGDLWTGVGAARDLLWTWVVRRNWLLLGNTRATLNCRRGRVQGLVRWLVQLGLRLIGLKGFVGRDEVEEGLALCIGSGFSIGKVSGHSGC